MAGSILLPLGVVLVLLGWYGAAHSPYVFQQIPYLVSGGVLGVALVVAGGFSYFGFWLSKLVYEGREQNQALLAALARMEARVGATPALGSPTPAASPVLLATPSGTMMHRPDCPIVAGKSGLRTVDPDDPKLEPCGICQPRVAQP